MPVLKKVFLGITGGVKKNKKFSPADGRRECLFSSVTI